GEAKRRQDMIRAGTYTNARLFKQASAPYRILMPIPQNQIETNPLLKQNPGY
ncbi:MAG: RagB/SusD family nutrient uptake outer membrane protein, partial [Gemmatimonas sp.]|nr:RagB/SusD family nutrient uptake outer membrane protein [Gemmatimonas sp.]